MTDVAIPTGTDVAEVTDWNQLATFDDGTATYINTFGLSMPRLRSDFGRNGTGWIDDLTGEAMKELDVIILAIPPSRAYWIKSIDEGGGGVPDCASRVNFAAGRPDDNVAQPQALTCAACPHSQWGEDGEKPKCAQSVNILAATADGESMFWMRVGGTGLKPFNKYVSALLARKLPPYAVVTHLTLDEDSRDNLKWLVPHFTVGEALTPAQVAPMREVAQKALAAFGSVLDEMDQADRRTESGGNDFPAEEWVGEGNEEPF